MRLGASRLASIGLDDFERTAFKQLKGGEGTVNLAKQRSEFSTSWDKTEIYVHRALGTLRPRKSIPTHFPVF
jgi:hypothetical protein